MNSSTLETVRLNTATRYPWSFIFKTRFWPITARPISPMSQLSFCIVGEGRACHFTVYGGPCSARAGTEVLPIRLRAPSCYGKGCIFEGIHEKGFNPWDHRPGRLLPGRIPDRKGI